MCCKVKHKENVCVCACICVLVCVLMGLYRLEYIQIPDL